MYTHPTKVSVKNKDYFPKGCLVSINGFDLDFGCYKNRKAAPTFYGCVEDPRNYGEYETKDLCDNEVLVSFIVAGLYEWYDKNSPNTLTASYPKSQLTFTAFPPSDTNQVVFSHEDDFTKWFYKSVHGWKVKAHEDPCYGCGSPWCLWSQYCVELKALLLQLDRNKNLTNTEKRYHCYREGISMKWGASWYAQHRTCGWCWVHKVCTTFPDGKGNYKGFEANPE